MEAKKGTTTVGIRGKDFVVLAADKMASMGDLAADLNTQKVHPVSKYMAITTAGLVGDLQILTRFLKARINRMKIEEGEEPHPRRIATFLGTILNANKYFPYWVQILLGGWKGEPYLASVDAAGGVTDTEPIMATGSGSPVAYGVLEANYKEGISEKDAIALAVQAVEAARVRNTFTGGREPGIDVAVIDKKGVRLLSPEEVAKIKKSLK
ncbi:MAG: proteasome beta subunit [Candidatus Diapherotrites archaeon]|nr:proteasome beta subunit [Candidatus Diapherotrites archaeon]MDN5366622.1 proteasome beta subunit [Candidatus Diapherotrites archaeon]